MGRKEDNIKKAQAIIHDKEGIRNIGTAAHIDHGKCISGDARVWANGEWIAAKDLWARFSHTPGLRNPYNAEVHAVPERSFWTRSIDIQSGDVSFSEISHVWRLIATEPLLAVET